MLRTLLSTAAVPWALAFAPLAQASIGCADVTNRPLAGQPEQPMPTGFEACATGALIAQGGTNVWRCKVRQGFEDKVNASYLIVVERNGRIVAQERDDLVEGPLDAMRWYEVDFDRDGTREHVIARRVMQTSAHDIQIWWVSIFSADWSKVIIGFEGIEDFGPDAMFRISEDQPCVILKTFYDAVSADSERLTLTAELWTVANGEAVALAGGPDNRLLDAAFIAERKRGMPPQEFERTPYHWLYGRDHDSTGDAK